MIQLGCIADDFTGATILANNPVHAGFRVVQCIGELDGVTYGRSGFGSRGAQVAHHRPTTPSQSRSPRWPGCLR
jgi:hypothetical protein